MKKVITWLSALGFVMLLVAIGAHIVAFTMIADYNKQPTTVVQPTKVIPLPDATETENRINAYRSEKGLSILADSPELDIAAEARANQMCADNDWSHEKDWWVLSQYYEYQYAGENLYYGTLTEEQSRKAVHDWVASPSHLENIVGNYSEFGIAVKSCPGFQGEPKAVIITNYFGVPR